VFATCSKSSAPAFSVGSSASRGFDVVCGFDVDWGFAIAYGPVSQYFAVAGESEVFCGFVECFCKSESVLGFEGGHRSDTSTSSVCIRHTFSDSDLSGFGPRGSFRRGRGFEDTCDSGRGFGPASETYPRGSFRVGLGGFLASARAYGTTSGVAWCSCCETRGFGCPA
jgi:hypothetical protein